MVRAKNRSERRVAGNICTRASRLNWRDDAYSSESPFSHRRLEVNVASLAISVVSARTLRSPAAGIGTELLAHREKIEVTRSGSTFERYPVPIGLRIAAAHGQFAHFPGECLKPETRWREGSGFELSVPVRKLADDSFQVVFAT